MDNENYGNALDTLADGKEYVSMTSGYSMYPMLKQHRDIVVIKPVTSPLSVYDVPLYKRGGCNKLVLHRIIKINPDGSLVIRGDNTYRKELDVKNEDIVGVLKAFYRKGKYYDCEKSRSYRVYILFMRLSYPVRWVWKTKLRPLLRRVKRKSKKILGIK